MNPVRAVHELITTGHRSTLPRRSLPRVNESDKKELGSRRSCDAPDTTHCGRFHNICEQSATNGSTYLLPPPHCSRYAGGIPASLGRLSKLSTLDLQSNKLTGAFDVVERVLMKHGFSARIRRFIPCRWDTPPVSRRERHEYAPPQRQSCR